MSATFSPACSIIAFTFSKDWRACAVISFGISPVAGLMGICPEVNTRLPKSTAWT